MCDLTPRPLSGGGEGEPMIGRATMHCARLAGRWEAE